MMSAILFSNPCFFSSEKGRLLGSAQTLSSLRSTISPVCAPAGPPPQARTMVNSTAVLPAGRPSEPPMPTLIADPRRPAAAQSAIGTRLQVTPHVVEIADDVLDRAEWRHDAGAGGVHIGAAVDDDFVELVLRQALDRVDEIGPVTAAR